ncbi:MAG: magnesium-translocating P-type ATPase [Saprospiraceae bacterium]|nr:magnesium-translocating P-type ATPase [Saprospiraceae bacterium]
MNSQDTKAFWQFDIDYWFEKLHSSEKGISELSAVNYQKTTGQESAGRSKFIKHIKLFFTQFLNPLMLLLIGAVILSAFLGDISEVIIIMFIVLSAGIVSFLQEMKAGNVITKLQSLISIKSTVLRDGTYVEIPAKSMVPGDVVIFNAGDIIAADCMLITSNELHVNEASLTGESFPVRKDLGTIQADTELSKRKNCLWEGTNIVSGKARALVINTGNNTIFGNIVQSSASNVESTFEKGINDFGYFLMKITLVLSFFILVVNLLNHKSIIDSTLFALALAVGMAPELLPAITTIAMSAGAKRLLEKKVIVKKLSSIQNLGEVNLLCTDKTGTLTEGNIIVDGIVDFTGLSSEFATKLVSWNATLETGYSNPIDEALKKIPLESEKNLVKTGEIPFDFIRKRLTIGVKTETEKLIICKGAFEQITEICTSVRRSDGKIEPYSEHSADIAKRYETYGQNGFRVIGICYKSTTENTISKEDEVDMIFAGFVLLMDPVKKGIKATIENLKKLHVSLKIITGDNKNVAQAIAKNVGIEQPVIMTGKELLQISPEALKQRVKSTHIFAEVEPQQKERIIQALRKSYTVAYMGDGINDVSAINAADIGISVENAVDIAKEAADFVLMEKDLSVILDGIMEGRKTFANTLKYIYISTGSTFGNMFSVAFASLILPFLPMLPKQILLTNFISDFPYMMIASDNVDTEQLEKPGKWNLKVINKYMVIFGIHSSFFDVITFIVLLYVLKAPESAFQTAWFVESVLSELCILFIIRTHKNFFKSRPAKYLFIMSVVALILTIVLPYLPYADKIGLIPLSVTQLLSMLSIVMLYILTADLLKIWFFKKYRHI